MTIRNKLYRSFGIVLAMPIAARQLVINALRGSGEVLAVYPDANSPLATKQVEMLFASEKSSDQVSVKCKIPTVIATIKIDPVVRKIKPGTIASKPVETPHALAPTPRWRYPHWSRPKRQYD